MNTRIAALGAVLALAAGSSYVSIPVAAQSKTAKPATAQKVDEEYTRLIKQNLQDPRITTELVDHLPASDTVPSPFKFLGRAVGAPGELTYAKDIYRYYEALAKAAPTRAKYWKVGATEEGRDIVLLAIGDENAIKNLDKYRDMLGELTDPRKTTEARARQLLHTAKPIYYAISGMHSPETGGPEMLIELAYRLIVEETPFIQNIRNNVITLITPVIEVDGREKQVDTYYFNKKRAPGDARLPLMYWGKYVQHDNNRDGMGQFLKLTQAVTKETIEWRPTVIHDLHEAQTYLYSSTGTGPYNNDIDPIVVSEWWMLAQNDVMEMTKRGVPGVWTYGFYDGWAPNYMFFIAHSHNSIGRFYEVQSYGPDPYTVTPGATTTSKEWFRPNPPLATIKWGPRNNTNIQESALLFSLSHVAKTKDLYLENYWLSATSQVNGMPKTGNAPLPYKKTAEFPNLAFVDSSDDIRGGMGVEGLVELARFVQEGGTLITEGSTVTIFPEYGITSGVTVEEPAQLFVRGSIPRAKITDMKSPISYGYGSADLPVYFNQSPVLNASGGGRGERPPADDLAQMRQMAQQ